MRRTLLALATLATILATAAPASASPDPGQYARWAAAFSCTPMAEPPYKSGTLIYGYGGFDCATGTLDEQGWVQIQRLSGSTWVNEGSPVTGGYDAEWWRKSDSTGCTASVVDATRRTHSWVYYTTFPGPDSPQSPHTVHAYSTGRFIAC